MAPITKAELAARIEALQKSLERETAKSARLEEQQAATGEILRVISSLPADVQPVFEAIADSVMRLFRAWSASVFRYENELIRLAATRGGLPGSSGPFMEQLQAPRRPPHDRPEGRAVLTRTVRRRSRRSPRARSIWCCST